MRAAVRNLCLALLSAAATPAPAQSDIRYDRDIRPILSDRCFLCHGADQAKREAKLRLDEPAGATTPRPHGLPVAPGKPADSLIWQRITSTDPDEVMPPPTSGKPALTDAQRDLIKRWIESGGSYETHWSFAPLAKPAVPDAPGSTPIDRFINATLQAHALSPSPAAPPEIQARRLFMDLTGLPPTPDELDAFLTDTANDAAGAYPRLVDRLLTTEPYRSRLAERLATPWLDQARFADTAGIHHDQGRSIWPWRDWVLRAFRDNMPYDRFVVEQLAGDLLPNATVDQIVASGFNRNHVTSDEGGAIDEEYLFEYAVDRTATTGSVFLGLTFGCARCHDHKFDPVTQHDFYSMLAFFNSIEEKGIDTRLDNPVVAYPPSVPVTTDESRARLHDLDAALAAADAGLDALARDPARAQRAAGFPTKLQTETGVRWFPTRVLTAASAAGATLTIQPDQSVLASGTNPAKDATTLEIEAQSPGARLLLLECLPDPSAGGRIGRNGNGNAVVSSLRVEGENGRVVPLAWLWADYAQTDQNFSAANLLTGDPLGWAVGGHERPGPRTLLVLLAEPLTSGRAKITIRSESTYANHTLVRPRLTLGEISPAGLDRLPMLAGPWYNAGPFRADPAKPPFPQEFDPEHATSLDLAAKFSDGHFWSFESRIAEGKPATGFSNIVGSIYLAREVYCPSPRRLSQKLGTDDGVRVLVNGAEAFRHDISRGLTPDADALTLDLPAGRSLCNYKVVNTGGPDGFVYRDEPDTSRLDDSLMPTLFPEAARPAGAATPQWLRATDDEYREKSDARAAIAAARAAVVASQPLTMVMKERPQPRATYIMNRGQYNQPDMNKPVTREVPAFLGKLPQDAPRDRLGLARWMVGPSNPLLARVAVNRTWELFFSRGLARTTDDLGLQGEYPSHPELLDHLASTFQGGGWDLHALIRAIVLSDAYRRDPRARPDALALDPDNRWLSFFPSQRWTGEQLRDQALYVSGLLHESFGGSSVRPYQPEGLWEEISMKDSNTGKFVRDQGESLYRRSVYTFWKRASPPPSLLAFDAPTREACTIRRTVTNTPLQTLVLWNDEQFVEAARAFAARAHRQPGSDADRLTWLFRAAASRRPSEAESSAMDETLRAFRARYAAAPDDAAKLLRVGASPPPADIAPDELAAWTMVASAVLSSDASIVKR